MKWLNFENDLKTHLHKNLSKYFSKHKKASCLINNYALALITCGKRKIIIYFLFFFSEITRQTLFFRFSFASEQNFFYTEINDN